MVGMFENKVVVISGVGPALGTTLARRCAEQGADLVLAARTVDRLDDVATKVRSLGRKALAVGTDITDDAQVDNLVEQALHGSLLAAAVIFIFLRNLTSLPLTF